MDVHPRYVGPYRIIEPLGRGGMGVVFRATDDGGNILALKTVHIGAEHQLSGLRREIHALACLRHPGIVRILDEGVSDGLPWYAMELLEGLTLKSLAERLEFGVKAAAEVSSPRSVGSTAGEPGAWWTRPLETGVDTPSLAGVPGLAAPGEPWRASAHPATHGARPHPIVSDRLRLLLGVVQRLCGTLAYLHGEGLVHRDLKSENILVRSDGMPVLVDFGLASQFGGKESREALAATSFAAGTINTMSPEQIRGELVDARADLYALGCILYELLTGRPPFIGELPVEVLWQHLNAEPDPPSKLVEGIPDTLDDLILRLLAKSPRLRIGYADDVTAVLWPLCHFESDGVEHGAREPKPRAYLYRPGFAGREGALRELEETIDRVERGQGAVVLIGGESGIGKTRFLLELARHSEARRVQVLVGECAPLETEPVGSDTRSGGALQPMRRALQAIADHCRRHGLDETARLLGRRGRTLEVYEPALRDLPGQERHPVPPELPPEAARIRLFGALSETLAAFSESKALVLMVDDLQWADELTLGFLGYLVRARALGAPQMPRVVVIGTYRTEENIEALRMLTGPGGARTVRLGRLDEHAVGEMVCEMLALANPPTEFVRYLRRESEGNPFFVAEYLRAAVREGLLWRDSVGSWQVAEPSEKKASPEAYARLPLPHSIRALIARHLDRLGESGRRLADAAAVLGKEVDLSLLASVSAMDPVDVLEGTVELLGQHVMEEARRGSLRFVHDKLREVAYQNVAEGQRAELHRAAAERLESFEPARRDENLAALARHWLAAGEADKAKPYWLAAARKARASYAHGEAERLYRGYLRLVTDPTPESIEARNQFAADVLLLQGKLEDAAAEHTKALAEARELGHLWSEAESLRFLGLLTRARGRPDAARELFEQALVRARLAGDRRMEGRVLGNLGICFYESAQFERARELFSQALVIHREVGERGFEGTVLCNLANTYNSQSWIDEARELYFESLAIHREVGDRRAEGLLFGNLASSFHDQGRFDDARRFNELALAIHREVGNRSSEGQCLRNLASSLHDQGRFDEARELYVEALAIHREVEDRRAEGVVLQRMGNACQDQGRIEDAWELYTKAVAIHRQVGNRRFEGMVLHDMANCARDQGRIAEARTLYEASLEIHREVGDRLEGMVLGALADLIRLTAGEVHHAERLAADGEAMLSDAGDRLELARLLCSRGHIELAGGRSARDLLERASTLGREMKVDSCSELGQKLARLARAQAAFEGKTGLFRGSVVADLAPGLRNWLEETGQLRAEGFRSEA